MQLRSSKGKGSGVQGVVPGGRVRLFACGVGNNRGLEQLHLHLCAPQRGSQINLTTGLSLAEALPAISLLLSHFLARAVALLLRGFASSQPRLH